jgi:hypothetical protein
VSQAVDQDVVRSLAWAIVRRVAPAEEVTFEFQADAYFADPQRALSGDQAGGDRLGSGLTDIVEVAVPVLTPVALAVATELVTRVVRERVEPGLKRAGRAISDAAGRLLGREPDEPEAPIADVPADERPEVHRIVLEIVVKHGEAEDVARRIAAAVAGETGAADEPSDEDQGAGRDGAEDDDDRR